VTALRFPAGIAVGEVEWEDPREPGGWGHLLATGEVEVPDGTAVRLAVKDVAQVSVFVRDRGGGGFAPAGAGSVPAVLRRRRRARDRRSPERVTWQRGMPGTALRNDSSIWGNPGESYSVEDGEEAVDLRFVRGLPADSVFDLSLGDVVPASFAAVAHLAPGLRHLAVTLDYLGDDAPSVIAELKALESMSLFGRATSDDGPWRLDDQVLSGIAGLPALESLTLLDGTYTERGLQQLRGLRRLRHLHIEREDLTASMFQFAAGMPALTRLTGLDEFGEGGPMPPAEVEQVRAMLPHLSMD
jgi:hypothetical protein